MLQTNPINLNHTLTVTINLVLIHVHIKEHTILNTKILLSTFSLQHPDTKTTTRRSYIIILTKKLVNYHTLIKVFKIHIIQNNLNSHTYKHLNIHYITRSNHTVTLIINPILHQIWTTECPLSNNKNQKNTQDHTLIMEHKLTNTKTMSRTHKLTHPRTKNR